jgi:hypothetical protein
MKTAWAHLPNARHIDWVLADLKARPVVWTAAWSAAHGAAQGAAWGAALDAAWDAAHDAARNTVWDAAWGAMQNAAWGAMQNAAWGALIALISYDDCAPLLECSVDHLRSLYRLNPHPSFLFLQPAVIAKNTP